MAAIINSQCVKTIFADSAYGRKGLPEFVKATLGIMIELVKRQPDQKGFQVLPKRWIVERTFAWLGFCRRNSKDYERNPETSEAISNNPNQHDSPEVETSRIDQIMN